MSAKYLGDNFDIHGGGMDLLFPHHECELAQNTASRGTGGVKYWMHNNMITINGQKMGKSLGNFITLEELFTGSHKILTQPYTPMTIRFFILQAHYRSTLDFSNEALVAAEKGYKKMMQAKRDISSINTKQGVLSPEIKSLHEGIYEALCDDMNTPIALAHLFDAVRIVNSAKDGQMTLTTEDKQVIEALFENIAEGVLGLTDEQSLTSNSKIINGVMEIVLEMRKEAKANRDFAKSDMIRDNLTRLGITIKDTKEGAEWSI
jgi:cysteinyl-tRNA synthetase